MPAPQEAHSVSISKTNWLMIFPEIIAVYSENYTLGINTLCGKNSKSFNMKAAGTCTKTLRFTG
jgi:hypothetical protein